MADAELREVVKKIEDLQKPDDYRNYYNGIEDSLDLALHGDKAVDKP
jgi:hypothetical protein